MEIYQIVNEKESSLDFLTDIINESGVNALIDREMLSMEILRQCGAMEPRYNTTKTFKLFAINFFKTNSNFIDRTLELLAIEYDALDTYKTVRDEKIDRVHTEDLFDEREDDLRERRTESYTDEHYVSAENESGVMLRTRDTHEDTDGQNSGIFNTGTRTTTGDNEFVHDDEIKITDHGYKTSPNVEFFNALARNEFNIYGKIAEKFSDTMCIGVF